MSHYSSSSSSTNENEVQVEDHDIVNDPREELMLCMFQLNRQIHEAYKSNNDMRRRRRFIQRIREVVHARLVNDYFSTNSVYPDNIFRRRFRMRPELFLRIVDALEAHSSYFQPRNNAARRKGLSALQKCTTAIRQLAYGVPADHLDEYLCMDESTAIKCLSMYCQNVVELFGDRYLRRPNADDIQRLLQSMKRGTDSLACWVALIVCTDNGKIVKLLGNANLQEVMGHRRSYLKQSRFVDMARILRGRVFT